jgi:hypothetical protein
MFCSKIVFKRINGNLRAGIASKQVADNPHTLLWAFVSLGSVLQLLLLVDIPLPRPIYILVSNVADR